MLEQWRCDECGCYDIQRIAKDVVVYNWYHIDETGQLEEIDEDMDIKGEISYECADCGKHLADSYEDLLIYLENWQLPEMKQPEEEDPLEGMKGREKE